MKIEIDVEVPEGWRVVDYRTAKKGEYYLYNNSSLCECVNFTLSRWPIVEKILPRRRIFECISEEPRRAVKGEWFEDGGSLNLVEGSNTLYTYKVWREVDESEES